MPRPAELEPRLRRLTEAWLAADREIQRRLLETILAIAGLEVEAGQRAALRRRADRLQELADAVDAELANMERITRLWIQGEMPPIYAASAEAAAAAVGVTWRWGDVSRTAVQILSDDVWETTLAATSFVSRDTKQVIGRLGRDASLLTETLGDTSRQASRRAAREARRLGIGRVTYRNGARHRIGEYMDMAIDTKVALANSAAAGNVYRAVGVEFVELTDGPDCGLFSHGGTPLANGQIVPLELFLAFPLAHPRCRRDAIPRRDLNGTGVSERVPDRTPERRQALEEFQRALAPSRSG